MGGGGRQKKSKYALNVWRMRSLDILLMNPISLPVFGTLETWLLVGPGVSLKVAFKSSKPTLRLFFRSHNFALIWREVKTISIFHRPVRE